ncbi:MAG TPA: nidogen-like domain-containing protein [Gemmataceae bacterium]|nr:nidogen-like domain-containing protein [Gemmataceae bacterium]
MSSPCCLTKTFRRFLPPCAAFLVALAILGDAEIQASPIVSTPTGTNFPGNDDGSAGPVALGFSANYFGTTYSSAFVNNNGNVTFGTALSTYTPFGLTSGGIPPIIAPFFADVDTRAGGSGTVHYGTVTIPSGTDAGKSAFFVNWPNVGYYGVHDDKLNNFQLLLVDRSDTGAGNFDIIFNYGQIQWETGDASGGSHGLGGASAVAGFSNGSGISGTFFQLPGSGVNGAFLDGGSNQLITGTNDGVPGQFLFTVRNGAVEQPTVPEPASIALFGMLGLAGAIYRWRRSVKA